MMPTQRQALPALRKRQCKRVCSPVAGMPDCTPDPWFWFGANPAGFGNGAACGQLSGYGRRQTRLPPFDDSLVRLASIRKPGIRELVPVSPSRPNRLVLSPLWPGGQQ